MDLSKEFLQYQIDNPHNTMFKQIVGKEDRDDTIEGFKRLINVINSQPNVNVNDTVYVVTRGCGGKKEIIKGTVVRKTYIKKFTFTVSGRYSDGRYYNGNFGSKSVGKTVFLSREEAEKHI